jgi:hypothetical protein
MGEKAAIRQRDVNLWGSELRTINWWIKYKLNHFNQKGA